MTTDPKREAFEKWADSQGYGVARYNDAYIDRGAAHAWFGWRAALSQPPEGEGRAEPVAQFADPRVKLVYDLLCDDNDYPNDPAQHWEGWIARRIVDALTAPSAGHGEGMCLPSGPDTE